MNEWVSEWILNGTSAQLRYTVPFTLDVLKNTGKYTRIKHSQNTQIKYNSEKEITQSVTMWRLYTSKCGAYVCVCVCQYDRIACCTFLLLLLRQVTTVQCGLSCEPICSTCRNTDQWLAFTDVNYVNSVNVMGDHMVSLYGEYMFNPAMPFRCQIEY